MTLPTTSPLPPPNRTSAPTGHVDALRSPRTTAARTLREVVALGRLFAARTRNRTEAVYDVLGAHNNLGRDTLYLNMGYWEEAQTYDTACAALAMRVALRGGLEAGMRVLDAGYGFGDQDIAWAETLGVEIVGFNVTRSQVDVARKRVEARGLAHKVDLRFGSALETGLSDASVDVVLAVESAFHFPSRDAFFREAHRVLKPGGRIVLADLVTTASEYQGGPRAKVGRFLATRFWQIPDENLYGADEYLARLTKSGFSNASVETISDRVFPPFAAHASRRAKESDVVARVNPLLRALWGRGSSERIFDYVIVSATRASAASR